MGYVFSHHGPLKGIIKNTECTEIRPPAKVQNLTTETLTCPGRDLLSKSCRGSHGVFPLFFLSVSVSQWFERFSS